MRSIAKTLLLLLLLPGPAIAGGLPSGLAPAEIANIVQALGFGATTRLMRTAEAYASWPGIKIGGEVVVAGSQNIGNFGNQNGNVPPINLLPRIYIAKGLFTNVEAIFSILPMPSPSGLASVGGALKWTFYQEREGFLSVAAYYAYTNIHAYGGDYSGNNTEFGIEASKDFVRIRPTSARASSSRRET